MFDLRGSSHTKPSLQNIKRHEAQRPQCGVERALIAEQDVVLAMLLIRTELRDAD